MSIAVGVSMAFSPWLAAQIKERKWSQNEFARRVRVDSGLVSRWLDGTRVPQVRSCEAIAKALDVPVQMVLDAAERKVRDPVPPEGWNIKNPLFDYIAKNADRLTPEQRQELFHDVQQQIAENQRRRE